MLAPERRPWSGGHGSMEAIMRRWLEEGSRIRLTALLMVVAMVAAACSGGTGEGTTTTAGGTTTTGGGTGTTEPAAEGGTLEVALLADIDEFDPQAFSAVNFPIIKNLYDSLIEYTADGEAIPWLATDWVINDDNT